MSSVVDIPHETWETPRRAPPASLDTPLRASLYQPHSSRRPSSPKPIPAAQFKGLYIIVFGYPPDRYSTTAEYFKGMGTDTTEPDPNLEVTNCFRIGYADLGEAMRAVRKSGEILCGSYMVGVKWAVRDDSCCLGLHLTNPIFTGSSGSRSPDRSRPS